MADDERKYTDEQMALILRRAGDLQEQLRRSGAALVERVVQAVGDEAGDA